MKTKYPDLVLFDQKIIDIHETNRRLLESQYVHFINYFTQIAKKSVWFELEH
jgi:hypothetical protein